MLHSSRSRSACATWRRAAVRPPRCSGWRPGSGWPWVGRRAPGTPRLGRRIVRKGVREGEAAADREGVDLAKAAGEGLEQETAARVGRQTGGNPFFIVEATGMLLQEHPEHRLGIEHGHLLPPTVQAVVASRIDHLPDRAKE